MSDNVSPKFPSDLKAVLEHTRGQFQYHAGQRLNTIRYFFVAYAIFVAAYVATIDGKVSVPLFVSFILGTTALIITLGFWCLDVRNVQMVHVDEKALEEIELLVTREYNFQNFEMAKRWEQAPVRGLFRYRIIVNILFFVMAAISAAAAWYAYVRMCAKQL